MPQVYDFNYVAVTMDLDPDNTFFISDEHFDWYWKQVQRDIAFRVPDIDKIMELTEKMNQYFNDDSVVWHLGDFCENEKILKYLVKPFAGRHYLVLGNHDLLPFHIYENFGFEDVWNCEVILNRRYILSHEPSENFKTLKYNIHGHSHGKGGKTKFSLPVYFNVDVPIYKYDVSACITDYKPTTLSKINSMFEKSGRLLSEI